MSSFNAMAARRRRARHFGLQALYQWSIAKADLASIEEQFRVDNDFSHTDTEYFQDLLKGVTRDVETLEAVFAPIIDRALDELDAVERNLLRMGTFELRDRVDIPYKVVINEAVSLAKKFGATESYRFINGVLDKVSQDLRSIERSEKFK